MIVSNFGRSVVLEGGFLFRDRRGGKVGGVRRWGVEVGSVVFYFRGF